MKLLAAEVYFQFIAHFFSISKLFFFGLLGFLTDFFLCVIYHYTFYFFFIFFIIILFKSLLHSFKFQRREIMSCLIKNILLEVIKIPLFIFKCATEQITHFNNFLFRFVCF